MTYATNRVISVPAGKCPVVLKSTEKEDVIEWAEDIYSFGLRNNINYLPTCYIFFAQQFFNIFSEDYKKVCDIIRSSYNTGVLETEELIKKIIFEKRVADIEKSDKKQKALFEEKEKIKSKLLEKKIEKKVETVEVKKTEVVEEKKKIKIRRK